ncbi:MULTISPECIES: citryl-CoA lyase [unclassified Herbaspirillum]|uniref:citryl-CoA lyase n=1 Tax=unclassified Herbaspirillum TaxID=2624150 RepID=UPI00115265F0|nr:MULTISPECIES: citryl-CoA lyase [unclassified Herbaspirillum]MBB5390284.1 citrate synthase [Herbaspirillum sp. SJZ102]TQK09218.1 citrate synthase [Herbaspirillum sp. SJZ130]TQK14095.1 citrate synthase [Herbaspirillum sp. SJZ106]TWC69794.1 citrate synthase [Herbaspirillum sp. SJZ099]
MTGKTADIRSDIAYSTPDRIVVRGKDLPNEILGKMNLGDFAYLQLTGKTATQQQSRMFNALLITLVEHGITPSAIAARMTYAGAPESLQAAVAAGLCGLGTVFVGTTEGSAKMLYEAFEGAGDQPDLQALAEQTVAAFRARKQAIPGLGHPVHKPIDPRTPRLFQLAEENDMAGKYVKLVQLIQAEAERATGKVLPINATGALGAICCEFGFPWQIVRGFGVMARAIGLVGHILEESQSPMSYRLWHEIEDRASAHLRG